MNTGNHTSAVAGLGFAKNVLWNWFGNLVGFFAAFFISPLMVRRLGDAGYGLWVVVFSLVEYYWMLDLGLRQAMVRFSSHYNARGEINKLNQALSTSMAYGLMLLPVLVGGAWFAGAKLGVWMNVHNPAFPSLFLVVSVSWALGTAFGCFASSLEGFQRFDVINQNMFLNTLVRSVGVFLLLITGHGILAVAYMTVGAQVVMYLANFLALRRIFPALQISPRNASWGMFREMFGYGIHGLISALAFRVLSQGPQLMLTYFLSERYAGYYGNPKQLLDYTTELVNRMGNVANPRTAELHATGRQTQILGLAILVNRFSLALFLPFSLFLAFYGKAFLTVWIRKPDFVAEAAPVLAALLISYTVALAGQYSCQSILFGMARHAPLAISMSVEAVLLVGGLLWLIPHYGLLGTAIWAAALSVLHRGVVIPWMMTRLLQTPFINYFLQVNRPLLAAGPVSAALYFLRAALPGRNWLELILAGGLTVLIYLPFVYLVIPGEDRILIWGHVRKVLDRFQTIEPPVKTSVT